MDHNRSIWYALAAAVIAILIAGVWYFSSNDQALAPTNQQGQTATSTATPTDSTTTSTGNNSNVEITGENTSGIQAPDLNRPYTPLATLPQSVQDSDRQAVQQAIQQLKIDPNHIAYWLQLAEYRKGANDFTGAEEIWLYVTRVWPTDPIAYNNLGDLYENYLHDYPKATTYWNNLIKLQPTNISAYLNLSTMYAINLKDKADAKTTLQAGLAANPGNKDLQNALNELQ